MTPTRRVTQTTAAETTTPRTVLLQHVADNPHNIQTIRNDHRKDNNDTCTNSYNTQNNHNKYYDHSLA